MKAIKQLLTITLITFMAQGSMASHHGGTKPGVHISDDSFEDTRDQVIDAIIDRGLVITYHAHIANMLERTSEAIGASGDVLDKGEGLFFCQAKLTHDLLEQDIHNIVHCPYGIYIYETDGNVYVSYRKSGDDVVGGQLDRFLEELVKEALE